MQTRLLSSPGTRTRRFRSGPGLLIIILLALLVLAVLVAVIWSVSKKREHPGDKDPDDITPSPYEFEEVEVTEPFIDFAGQHVPIVDGVPTNDYGAENFTVNSDGRVEYTAGWFAHGVDVSAHQERIDWEAVAESGVEFAMIRAAYRGYGSGRLLLDDMFYENLEGALNAGLEVGVYVFSQAVNVKEAVEEADFLLEAVEGYPVTYPLVFDWERITYDDARTAELGPEVMSACAMAFCQRVAEAGYQPSVYINMTQGYFDFDLKIISQYDIWLAEYDDHPDFYYHFSLWQYTSEGYVPGIEGEVDLNLSFRDFAG